jgi:serine/threonine protein kinase/Flp pilus assembly protein TadD
MREAEATAKLNHPNIITIYDVNDFNGRLFFSMELIEGQSLQEQIQSSKIDLPKIIEYAIQICEAINTAHEHKILHRDIKPSNILIDNYGRPKILDFGLATIQGNVKLTQIGSTIGTVRYMSPEQVEGIDIDARSDLYSFGVVLYEMITSKTPFERNSNNATIKAILQENPEPVSKFRDNVPNVMRNIVFKLLEKNRDLRYQDAKRLLTDLKQLSNDNTDEKDNKPSIAVLPFSNMSTDLEQEFFCEGIAEDILNHLAQIENLRVVSRTSSFAFKNTKEDLREVGRKLMVESILEGSVRKAGNRLRITAQLIKAEDGYHLWSEQYNRELDDVFAIQDEISESIVKALRIKLEPNKELKRPIVPTRVMEAYELYLQGRVMFHLSRKKDLESAKNLFTKAIELDPGYALAYAGLADTLSIKYMFSGNDENDLNDAIKASTKAIELNPDLAEAYSAHGIAISQKKQYKEAEENFLKAINLNPNLFEAYYNYGRVCYIQGDYEKACRLLEQAGKVKLDDYQAPFLAASLYSKLDQHEEMNETARRGLNIAKRQLELNPNDVRAVYLSAVAFQQLGDFESAIEWAERAINMEPDDHPVYYNVACIYSLLGQIDKAINYLKKAINVGFSARVWIESDPDLDPIRNHPEYEDVLNSIK